MASEGGTAGSDTERHYTPSGSDEKVKNDPFPSSPHSLLSPSSHPSSHSSSSSTPPCCDLDQQGSHQALQKAFFGLKQRLDDSNSQKHALIQKVKRLQSALDCATGRGMAASSSPMEDAAVGSSSDGLQDGGEAGLQQAAEEGFATNLQRQLGRARVQLQAVEVKYQEKLQENDNSLCTMRQELEHAHAHIQRLEEEKTTLQQRYEDERQEKEGALQVLNDLTQKCHNLQLEKEKMIKDAAILHNSLRKAHHEVTLLKAKQGEGTESVNATELAVEVAYMRQVIKNLKDMVLDQKQRLGNCGKMLSLSTKPSLALSYHHDPGSVGESNSPLTGSSRPAGSASGQSWEMVNITHPPAPSLNPRQQQEQQQQQQLRAMQQRCVTSSSSAVTPPWSSHNVMSNNNNNNNNAAAAKPSLMKMDPYRPQTLCNGPPPKTWGSHSEVLQRQPSQGLTLPPKSRTDVLKASTSKPHDFVDGGDFAPLLLGEERTSPHLLLSPPAQKLSALSPDPLSGLNHLGDLTDFTQELTSPTRLTSPPRPPSAGAMGNHAAMLGSQLMKGQPALLGVDSFGACKTTSPSMHILNPGVMAGARVIRNDSDSFGSSGGTVMMAAASVAQQGFPPTAPRNQQAAGPFAQEHDDMTQFTAAAMSELSPMDESNFLPRPVIQPGGQSALDRKCPVCGQDFSQVSMDEFQIHVFECFDNAEENASAPQTLQAEGKGAGTPQKKQTGGGERVCPMCDKRFPANTTQPYFEGHVQSHFEEQSRVAEQFEVLNLKES